MRSCWPGRALIGGCIGVSFSRWGLTYFSALRIIIVRGSDTQKAVNPTNKWELKKRGWVARFSPFFFGEVSMSFSFYMVDADYCDYLRKSDPCVPYTMENKPKINKKLLAFYPPICYHLNVVTKKEMVL